MIANGKPSDRDSPGKTGPKLTKQGAVAALKKIVQQVRLLHVFAAMGVLSILIGYLSVAPPSELPSWPLYSLNARTWQFFEQWGQHVKPYHMRVMTMALQHHESRALYILAYLEIPDIIKNAGKPLGCEEIKVKVDKRMGYDPINLPYLCRILHAAAHFDLLEEAAEEKYSLTPLSEYLTSSHPKSLKGFVKLYSGDEALVVSTAISRSMFTGNSGFRETYRVELSKQLKLDPQLQQVHDAGLADYARLHAPAIIADYPLFGSCKHICDIGGGIGSFLNSILSYYSYNMRGTNFDLPDVINNARLFVKAMKVQDKISLVPGNFTENIPEFDCDCYILKDILEEWSDEDAVLILSKLSSAMKNGGRLLIMERVLHTGSHSEERFKALFDLTMMAFNPSQSRLRTEEELIFLLQQTGFLDQRTYPTRAGYSIIESFPAQK